MSLNHPINLRHNGIILCHSDGCSMLFVRSLQKEVPKVIFPESRHIHLMDIFCQLTEVPHALHVLVVFHFIPVRFHFLS